MNIKELEKITDRKNVINFTPHSLRWMTEQDIIIDENGNELKTHFLLDIVHTLRVKTNKCMGDHERIMEGFPLSSKILLENYHNDYVDYLNYLQNNRIIVKTKEHMKGKNSKMYRLNKNIQEESYFYYYNDHKKIVRKKKERDLKALTDPKSSYIDVEVRGHLFKDLFKFEVDEFHAMHVLDTLMEKEKINANKKKVNKQTYEAINAKCLDFTFDLHGRFHSNFTRLKKEIRETCLRVEYNGNVEETFEVDIKNSQPMFLLLLLRDNLTDIDFDEFNDYRRECHLGDIYKRLMRMYELSHSGEKITRKEAKEMFYQYLFGKVSNKESRKMFKRMFPSIDRWMSRYKKEHGYKTVAHELQRLESNLIYNNIIKEIKELNPNIPIVTVHDSLIVPKSCKDVVEDVFYKYVNAVFEDVLEELI